MAIDIERLTAEVDARLAGADAALAAQFPGNRPGRQPVHTVYVPADRYAAESCSAWGAEALKTLDEHGQLFADLVADEEIVQRVRDKLEHEPIEDLRIDFEDGYGRKPDDVEDADVAKAAAALAGSQQHGGAPPFHGIRIKSLEAPTRARGLRTLALFLTELVAAGGRPGVVTLPKVTSVDQVEAMVFACSQIETAMGLDGLQFEIQVETPQSILGPDGTALVARMIQAAQGRCSGLHYGTYDYSAFCGIAAEYQSMAHPVADHAKLVMQAAAAGTGVRLSDGSTNVLPVGANLRRGWQLHLDLVRRSLERGYYQGWDLHPAQLPTRYAATFAFYRDGLDAALTRLRNYLEHADSAILDEPATARALADFILRALQCGATTEAEIADATGLDANAVTGLARGGR
ncbi:MAG TPA: aldolase [Jatrophihabitans sp.]|nr:aldolase [Jatrophihabitans sp.]